MKDNVFKKIKKNHQIWHSYEGETQAIKFNFGLKSHK
jgi:hypothetical protein